MHLKLNPYPFFMLASQVLLFPTPLASYLAFFILKPKRISTHKKPAGSTLKFYSITHKLLSANTSYSRRSQCLTPTQH
jgi:hypothetical protein